VNDTGSSSGSTSVLKYLLLKFWNFMKNFWKC
jgi:hypothetical protein